MAKKEPGCLSIVALVIGVIAVILCFTGVGAIAGVPMLGIAHMCNAIAKGSMKKK